MKIVLNSNNEITEFTQIGGLPKSIEFSGTIPDDFESQFKPSFYLLQNNEIVVNPDYSAPVFELPEMSGPTTEQQMINQLGLQVATLTAEVNQLKGGGPNV